MSNIPEDVQPERSKAWLAAALAAVSVVALAALDFGLTEFLNRS